MIVLFKKHNPQNDTISVKHLLAGCMYGSATRNLGDVTVNPCRCQVTVQFSYWNRDRSRGYVVSHYYYSLSDTVSVQSKCTTGFRVPLPDQTLLRFRYFNITTSPIGYRTGTVETYYRVQGPTTRPNPTKVQVF